MNTAKLQIIFLSLDKTQQIALDILYCYHESKIKACVDEVVKDFAEAKSSKDEMEKYKG